VVTIEFAKLPIAHGTGSGGEPVISHGNAMPAPSSTGDNAIVGVLDARTVEALATASTRDNAAGGGGGERGRVSV